ncbi:MAG TPA: sugar-binding protein [Verrucomicrobiae bacterium]|nr:sugar-binding protein [Verrucomicrobiae bacterium]
MAIVFAGCGPKDSSSAASSSKKLRLAFVPNTAANFWTIARAGCDDAARSLGDVEVDFRIPSSGSAAEQQQILDELLARGVDGVAVSPVDPANQTSFLNKIASQTLLICQDSDAPASKRVCYIGTDNVAAGVQAGKLIKEAIPQGGKIMVFVGKLDAQNARERLQGIKQELHGTACQIIDVRTDDADPVRARKNAEDALVKYPDLACMAGLWAYNGPAILNAVKAAGKTGAVKIVCFDEDDETLAGVAEGAIYGTVVQQPYDFGKEAITRMEKYLHGDKSVFASGKLIIPTLSVTKEKVADFQARLKKLLGKS